MVLEISFSGTISTGQLSKVGIWGPKFIDLINKILSAKYKSRHTYIQMKWPAAIWLSVRTSLGKGFSGSLFIKAISLIWLLLTETFSLEFWTQRSRHPQEGGRFQPLPLLVGYKLGNPFKGFILFFKKSSGVFVWTMSFFCFYIYQILRGMVLLKNNKDLLLWS